MPKPWYSIKAAADDAVEVSIHDEISRWYGVSALTFLAELRAVKASRVRVSINSYGGHVVEALAMFNGLRAMGKQIDVKVIGIAASAASYVAMAGDKITMPRNTAMVLHKPANEGTGGGRGTADDHRTMADQLDAVESLLLPAYRARFKGTDEELAAVMEAEDLLTAEQCLALGLCDEVVDEITATASFDVEKLPPAARQLFAAPQAQAPAAPAAPARPGTAEIERIAAEAGVTAYAGVLAMDDRLATREALAAAAAEIAEIQALCRVTGVEAQAERFVRSRATYAEARAAIAKARANDDVGGPDTARRSDPAAPATFNPSALWREITPLMTKPGSTQ